MNSHVKTFLTIPVQTAEPTARELACEQAPSEDAKKNPAGDWGGGGESAS